MRRNFKLWDYNEVRSPSIEFVETLSTGVGPELVNSMFKFQDFDGKLLALRAEMTAPVARLVTTRMPTIPEPIRLFYITNVFRYSQSYLKTEREFYQAGVELIGSNTPEADGEILALLISVLKKIGLKDVRIDLGHASLLKDLMNVIDLNKKKKGSIQSLLACRDFAGLNSFMEENSFPTDLQDVFRQLSQCRKLNDVFPISLDTSKYDKVTKNLERLTFLQEILADYEIEDLIFFDFSLTKKIEYYTGIVFEASVPNLGLPLGSGGRYDNFIEKFGRLNLPATGFALEIGKLLQALTAQGFEIQKKPKPKIIVSSKPRKTAIEIVEILRKNGIISSLEITKRDIKKTLEYARISEIDYLISIGSTLKEPLTIFDLKANESEKMMLKTFLRKFGGQKL